MDDARRLAAEAKAPQILRHAHHQPAHFGDQRPALRRIRGKLALAEGLVGRILHFRAGHGHAAPSFKVQLLGSRGMPTSRSAMMLRCTSSLPPAMVQA